MSKPVELTFFKRYLDRVKGNDFSLLLADSCNYVLSYLDSINEETSRYRYAPEKWNIKEVLSHVIDVERVMAFRVLWFSRGQQDSLEGFDDVIWEEHSNAADQHWEQLVEDYKTTRASTLAMLRTLPTESLQMRGVASDVEFTVDSLLRVIVGHEQHHIDILKERYLV